MRIWTSSRCHCHADYTFLQNYLKRLQRRYESLYLLFVGMFSAEKDEVNEKGFILKLNLLHLVESHESEPVR